MEKKTEKKARHLYTGEVVSDKMDKTIIVKTVRTYKHPRFHKILEKVKKYKVHDEKQEAKIGDIVEFYEGAPISKMKYMYLARIVRIEPGNSK